MTLEATAIDARTGRYVFGVVTGGDAEAVAALPLEPVAGGAGVSLVREGPLAAIVSPVSLDEYDLETVHARVADVDWLERNVRAHENVLEQALHMAPVVPFRFCTVSPTEGDVRRLLSEHADELARVLERIRGKVELGVKAFFDRERLERKLAQAGLADDLSDAGPGRAYLLRRQRERELGGEVERFRSECAEQSHSHLSELADDSCLVALQPLELTGRDGEMLHNDAYIVRRGLASLEPAVAGLADRYREYGVSFELTGPWPPHNFVPRQLAAS